MTIKLPTIDPVIKREKTPEQRNAQKELFLLTDEYLDPNWFNDPRKVKRRNELVAILEPEPTEEELIELYFAKRPGLKEQVLSLMANGATNTEVYKVIGVATGKPITYLRRKYGFASRTKHTAQHRKGGSY